MVIFLKIALMLAAFGSAVLFAAYMVFKQDKHGYVVWLEDGQSKPKHYRIIQEKTNNLLIRMKEDEWYNVYWPVDGTWVKRKDPHVQGLVEK